MGTRGYERARTVTYRPDEVILEIGSGTSTYWLADIGPEVVTIDPAANFSLPLIATVYQGFAEVELEGWTRPIGFAWLDGHDFPYEGNPPGYYAEQRAQYEERGQVLSRNASRFSHLQIAMHIAPYARVIAFDDTWRTHTCEETVFCQAPVPPATQPAPALAMDQGLPGRRCGLPVLHPHHNEPERGWDGKGGTAIPYLLGRGFTVVEYGLGLVVLEKEETHA